jgi:hypothetical protein
VAIKWAFYRGSSGHYRWEVQAARGPIATSGKPFESIEVCVADARERGYEGSADPPVSAAPSLPAREEKTPKAGRSARETVRK